MRTHTRGSTAVCPEYGGIHVSKASDIIFPVGVAMCTRTVEHYKAVFQSSPSLLVGRKDIDRG